MLLYDKYIKTIRLILTMYMMQDAHSAVRFLDQQKSIKFSTWNKKKKEIYQYVNIER